MSTPAKSTERGSVIKKIAHGLEWVLFNGRWVLAPLYLGLLVSLIGLMVKFGQELFYLVSDILNQNMHEVTLGVLALLDITLLGNLILIVIFSGYENFVSKIGVAEGNEDRPEWMGQVDYSGLKIKLIGSLVAISVIELLKDFMDVDKVTHDDIKWRVVIHLTFVISGVLFAVMDYLADKRHALADHDAP